MRIEIDLKNCSNEELRTICNILMYDNKGKIRISEALSNSDEFLSYYPDNIAGI